MPELRRDLGTFPRLQRQAPGWLLALSRRLNEDGILPIVCARVPRGPQKSERRQPASSAIRWMSGAMFLAATMAALTGGDPCSVRREQSARQSEDRGVS